MKLAKADLRREIRCRLKTLSPADRAAAGASLAAKIAALPEWRTAQSVLLFVPLPDEPAVGALLELALVLGKRTVLPAFDAVSGSYLGRQVTNPATDLIVGKFGAQEPAPGCLAVPVGTLDFAVVPGVAFTPDGKRLGRGRGFYDRMLASFRGVSCGVGFDEQIVPELPVEPHDVKLSYVATPTRVWNCRPPPAF